MASQAEDAAGQRNLKDLYMLTRKLIGKFQQSNMPIRNKEGQMLMTTEQQLKQWVEHFTDLLNRPAPKEQPNISQAEVDLPISVEKPSKEEIKKAIRTLKNGKAAGPDGIPAEALKADKDTAKDILHNLFAKIWDEEKVPADWREGLVITLPKKGDYRGIMLLSVPGKVLNRVILDRVKDAVDPQLRDQQPGFRRNRSCADQISSLRIIIEQSLEWNSPLYINFIDYEKAFDSVDRQTLWSCLGTREYQ